MDDQGRAKLYRINDVLEALASELGVRPERFGTEADYDNWLNDLTHQVAEQMGVV